MKFIILILPSLDTVTTCINFIGLTHARLYTFLFVCLGFVVPIENFLLIWRRQHYRWRAVKYDLRSALMAIEQWGFFSVPNLLRQRASVYNGHLRGPVTQTIIGERLAVELSLRTTCFYDLGLSRLGFEHLTFRLRGECYNPLRETLISEFWIILTEILIKNGRGTPTATHSTTGVNITSTCPLSSR